MVVIFSTFPTLIFNAETNTVMRKNIPQGYPQLGWLLNWSPWPDTGLPSEHAQNWHPEHLQKIKSESSTFFHLPEVVNMTYLQASPVQSWWSCLSTFPCTLGRHTHCLLTQGAIMTQQSSLPTDQPAVLTCEVVMVFPLLSHSVVSHVFSLAADTLLHIAIAM